MSIRDDAARNYRTEALQVTAVLRIPLLLMMLMVGTVVPVDHWLPWVYRGLLLFWIAVSVVWVWLVWRGGLRWWAVEATTVVDILGLITLCAASGGATSVLLPVFFVMPVAAAFLHGPKVTAVLGLVTVVGFFLVWVFYAVRDDTVDLPAVTYLYAGFLAWLAAAMTALSAVLERRSTAVGELLSARRKLTTEALQAEERERRLLAENLHDAPLQNVLAARMDVEEAMETCDEPSLSRAESILRETITALRSTVSTLNPQVLEQLGLAAALRELVDQNAARGGFATETEIEDVGKPVEQSLLYSVARELLGNIVKHSEAGCVRLSLKREGRYFVLVISDDGAGFDPSVLPAKIADGHIGLASRVLRVEAVGGTWDLRSAPGTGTRTVVRIPDGPERGGADVRRPDGDHRDGGVRSSDVL